MFMQTSNHRNDGLFYGLALYGHKTYQVYWTYKFLTLLLNYINLSSDFVSNHLKLYVNLTLTSNWFSIWKSSTIFLEYLTNAYEFCLTTIFSCLLQPLLCVTGVSAKRSVSPLLAPSSCSAATVHGWRPLNQTFFLRCLHSLMRLVFNKVLQRICI